MKIVILFFGLIAHVNQPWSWDNTAVLPRAPYHDATMTIPKPAVPPGLDKWFDQWLNGPGTDYVIKLNGLDVRLRDTKGVWADPQPDYLAAVPKLKTVAPKCGKMKKAIRNRDNTSRIVSFFDYRAGRLEVNEYLKDKIDFGAGERCAACSVKLTVSLEETHARLVITEEDGMQHEISVAGGATIMVGNVPSRDLGGHFKHYYDILNDCDDGPPIEIGGACTQSPVCDPKQKPFPYADCTNSQFP